MIAKLVSVSSKTTINGLNVSAYAIPTDATESDGTFEWHKTILVVVEVTAGDVRGFGYTYADTGTAKLIQDVLADVVTGCDPMAVPGIWEAMVQSIRNLGRPGIASMAISAVDAALWDLKARLLNVPLGTLLGAVHDSVPVYGSGGFTSYSILRLQEQLSRWAAEGLSRVKIKIGRNPAEDIARVKAAREAIGADVELFVDANGAYSRKQALFFAEAFADYNVTWFEEPVPSHDLEGLRLLRDRAPAGIDISAGEYGYDLPYFRRMLDAGAVDVLQADASRCAGITEFLRVGALCQAYSLPLSSHTAPTLHLPACCALSAVRHLEYFYDHVRIEKMLFDGVLTPVNGALQPDLSKPGLGVEFKRVDAEKYAI